MEIKTNYIPHNFRNKYLKNTGGYASSSSSFSSTGNGLPYVLDENGNYVVEKQVLFKKSIVSKGEVVSYGEDDIDYVATYAPLNHSHTISDVDNLEETINNIVASAGTSSIEVVDSLDSLSSTAALSAKQGKILSELIADKTVTWDTLQNKPSTFAPSAHSHAITEITGLNTELNNKANVNHTHSVANVTGLQGLLDSKANSSHTHSIANISNLQGQLDGKASSSHSHVISGITGLSTELSNKANVNHSHSISGITNLQNQLDSKASSSHTHSISNITNLQTELNKKSDTGHTHTTSDITNLREGLPYTVDANGNYVIEKQVLFKKSIISKEEVVAYGEDDKKYVATYAPFNHSHTIGDVDNLEKTINNIVASGGTKIEVIDNLNSVSSNAALSARQGKILSELIADKTITWDTLQNKPSTFTPSVHSHVISGITGLSTELSNKANVSHTHSVANVTGLQGLLDGKASSSHSHQISGITNLQTELNKKSDTAHTHDSRYYTETEVNNLLAAKASSSHTHTIANVTNLQSQLDSKASSSHSHTIANISNLQAQLDSKASSSHTHTISNITNLQTQLDSKVNTSSISTLSVKNSDTVDNLHASSFMRSDANTSCSGTITCANLISTGEVTSYSDRRLKTDIKSLNNRGLLNPVTYIKNNKKQIGFIAQDVQEAYPELITEDANGYLSLNYQQLTAVLSSQINDLYSIINELKLEISKLKNK